MSEARFAVKPVTLQGRHVILEPLSIDHHDGLAEATRDGDLWKLWYTPVPSPEEMRADIERRLGEQRNGTMLPFVVRNAASGKIVGATTYMNIEVVRHRVEIGATWYAKSVQRTELNTEAKYLLLRHAFETLNCIAVEFRTSFFNHASRRAIERLGARQDGILRSYGWHKDGTLRDTVVFSIVAGEWQAVKSNLEFKLASR